MTLMSSPAPHVTLEGTCSYLDGAYARKTLTDAFPMVDACYAPKHHGEMLSDNHIAIAYKGNVAVLPVHWLDRDSAESRIYVSLQQMFQTHRLVTHLFNSNTRLPEG